MKICVYAIMKNESWCIERFIESAKTADMVLIADTGSNSNEFTACAGIVQRYSNVKLVRVHVSPWRFDTARDAVLAQIPPDMEICVSLDLDEVLQPGWREEIERAWVPGTTRLKYMFDWGQGIAFWYDKIHARDGYRWKNKIHEFPIPYAIEERTSWCSNKLMVVHKPNGHGRPQYLQMLKESVEEDPLEPRNAFYYARELTFTGQWEESIKECNRYLALPGATWKGERSYAYRTMGRAHKAMGRPAEAEVAFLLAGAECPTAREPWCELAQMASEKADWAGSLAMAMKCLSITDREQSYTVDPKVWRSEPHKWASVAAYYLGLYVMAEEQGLLALSLDPDDKLLATNYTFYQAKLEQLKCQGSMTPALTPSGSKTKAPSPPQSRRLRRSNGAFRRKLTSPGATP